MISINGKPSLFLELNNSIKKEKFPFQMLLNCQSLSLEEVRVFS